MCPREVRMTTSLSIAIERTPAVRTKTRLANLCGLPHHEVIRMVRGERLIPIDAAKKFQQFLPGWEPSEKQLYNPDQRRLL